MTRLYLTLIILIAFTLVSCGQKNSTTITDKEKNISIDSLIQLATVSDSLNELKKSVTYYTHILQIDSLKLIALVNRGRAFIALGQTDKGFADYDKAIKHYPDENTYYARGMAFCMINNFNKAFNDFSIAINLNPKFGQAYYGYSLVKINDKQFSYALYWCNKADSLSYNEGMSKYIREKIKKEQH